LKYAHENVCPWSRRWNIDTYSYEDACSNAAKNGHLECLKYAHENGCPWNEVTCSYAAGRHLECLKYAHENGCPWDEDTCSEATFKSLKYAHENGCPGSSKYAHLQELDWDSDSDS